MYLVKQLQVVQKKSPGLLWLFISTLLSLHDHDHNNNTTTHGDYYAVVFDAGSTGSRVHVFRFDNDMDLLPITPNSTDYEFFLSIKPGLSAYESDPNGAALSLKPPLEEAQDVVPQQLRSTTPLKLGATAGLRLLPGTASEAILEAVRNLFETDSSLYYKPDSVSVLKGSDEGAYMWMTVNYLLGRLGGNYKNTVAVVDLGGGSVQMAYAISDKSAANAPPAPGDGQEPYVLDKVILGSEYNLYVHSYLNYGLKAGRAEALKLSSKSKSNNNNNNNNGGNPCITNGYKGTYDYNGVVYEVSSPASGTNLRKCMGLIRKALRVDEPCPYPNSEGRGCSFNGVWNGGGGAGQDSLYISSFFYDTAAESGVLLSPDVDVGGGMARPIDYLKAAKKACVANADNINSTFPLIDERDVPFLCMDLVYEYTLLVQGFGILPRKRITVLKEVPYKGTALGTAWPLGCAVDLLSSSSK